MRRVAFVQVEMRASRDRARAHEGVASKRGHVAVGVRDEDERPFGATERGERQPQEQDTRPRPAHRRVRAKVRGVEEPRAGHREAEQTSRERARSAERERLVEHRNAQSKANCHRAGQSAARAGARRAQGAAEERTRQGQGEDGRVDVQAEREDQEARGDQQVARGRVGAHSSRLGLDNWRSQDSV